MPTRLPLPQGPTPTPTPASQISTNPLVNYLQTGTGIGPSQTQTTNPLVNFLRTGASNVGPTAPSTSMAVSGLGGKRLPQTVAQPTQPSTFGQSSSGVGWTVNGQAISPAGPAENPLLLNTGVKQTYETSANAGMNKSNPFNIRNTLQPATGKQSTGLNESREKNYFNPETANYQNEPFYDLKFTKIEPIDILTNDAEKPSFTLDTVPFYDATIANYDENIKAWMEDNTKTYLLPDANAWTGITQEQYDMINLQAPGGYIYTPWGWMSQDYINSLTGAAPTTDYGYGGYSWGGGGGGGGGRSKLDQFYFGLMNWGI